ncbi:MAG: LD-carboxypeptidase [Butyrivibrio sp.]|nr:LD-carboxypeptidase [Muribaculum sp.]MCM1552276.1 LD-carboxypeptidase [Butyrivibrio sp.]
MRYPKNLPNGGTIGFVAPSFGCQIEPYRSGFENAQRKFRELGYGIQTGPNCYAGEGIGISNKPQACAAELTDYYCSGENDCLISCGGGELMCEILPYIDFESIGKAAPKWYMGYSDNTNFTYLQATLCDTAAIYGPCAAAFGMEPWHRALEDAVGLLTGEQEVVRGYDKWETESLKDAEHPLEPYNVTQERALKSYIGRVPAGGEDIRMRGRLLGGCMDCLVTLLGTRFDRTAEFVANYREDGIIWFLEACDLNVFGIRRAMWQMEEAGWLEHVKGFLIGRPLCFGQEMMGLDAYEAVLEVAGRKQVPVVMDVDLGHLPPMMPLIVGSVGEVDVKGNDIAVRMKRV